MGNIVNQVNTAYGDQIKTAEKEVSDLTLKLKQEEASYSALASAKNSAESLYRQRFEASQSKARECDAINLKTGGVNRTNINKKKSECRSQQRSLESQEHDALAAFQSASSALDQQGVIVSDTKQRLAVSNKKLEDLRQEYANALNKANEQERINATSDTQNQVDIAQASNVDIQKLKFEAAQKKAEVDAQTAQKKLEEESSQKTKMWIIISVVVVAIIITGAVILMRNRS
jgi:hypothetical protein